MCYFLTFATSRPFQYEDGRYGPLIKPYPARISGHAYPKGYAAYSVTVGGCSCDLVCVGVERNSVERKIKRLRKKAAKAGWSQVKIDRAVRDATARSEEAREGIRSDVRAIIAEAANVTGEAQVIVHWHHGSFDAEEFSVEDEKKMDSSEFRNSFELVEDCRYTIKAEEAGET